MPIKIPDNLTKDDLDAFFMAQGKDSPLAMALGNFNTNRLPSPAVSADPNIAPTPIPKLDLANFSAPVGMGSWFNISPQLRQVWNDIRDSKARNDEFRRQNEQAQISKLISSNPELTGQDPAAWDLKGLQAYLRQLKVAKPDNPLKTQKDKLAIEKAKLQNDALRKKNSLINIFDISNSTAPVIGSAIKPKTASYVLSKFGL